MHGQLQGVYYAHFDVAVVRLRTFNRVVNRTDHVNYMAELQVAPERWHARANLQRIVTNRALEIIYLVFYLVATFLQNYA